MPSVSEILQNATADELRTVCGAITPFVEGGKPPQILMLNDQKVIGILQKYGLIDKNLDNAHPELGKVQIQSSGGVATLYIEPTDDSINKTNNQNGNGKGSPFDGITALAVAKDAEDKSKKLDEALKKGFNDKTLFARVVESKDPKTGDKTETIEYWAYDPEETKRRKESAQKEGKDPNKVPAQYKIIDPYAGPIPTYRGEDAQTILGQPPGYPDISSGSSVSPMGQISGAWRIIENTNTDQNQSVASKGVTTRGLLAVAIKLTNAAGVLGDIKNFQAHVAEPGSWGGMMHKSKNVLISIRVIYNNVEGGFHLVNGLIKMANGDESGADAEFDLAFKILKTEYMTIPETVGFFNLVSAPLTTLWPYSYKKTGTGSGRGSNILSKAEINYLKEKNPELFREIYGDRIGGGLTAEQADRARKWIAESGGFKGRILKISGALQVIYYGLEYIVIPLLEENIENVEKSKEFEEKTKEAENTGTSQVGITRSSNNTIVIDGDDIRAIDPYTGKLINIQLPSIGSMLNKNTITEPSVALGLPEIVVEAEPPSWWEKMISYVAHGIHAVGSVIEESDAIPENVRLWWDTVGEIVNLKAISGVTSWALGKLGIEFPTFIPKALGFIETKIANPIGNFLLRSEVFAITAFMTPTPLGDATLSGVLIKEKEELEKKLGTKLTQEERENIIKKIEEIDKRIKVYKDNAELLPPSQDSELNSNISLAMEVERAKSEYDKYSSIVSSLANDVGEQMENGTSSIPDVPLEDINQEVSYAINVDYSQPVWSNLTPNLNTPASTPGCFPNYTMIKTIDGHKQISEFSVGDSVISFNIEGILEEDTVSGLFIHNEKEIYRYHFSNGAIIDITKEHPVLTQDNIFQEIGNLTIGDSVIDVYGNSLIIDKIQFLSIGTVYNIEVLKNHTYIADGFRVHNKLGQAIDQSTNRENARKIVAFLSDKKYDKEYEEWLKENFPDSIMESGRLVEISYPPIPGESVGSETGGEPPYSGPPPVGGTIPELNSFTNSPIASYAPNGEVFYGPGG